MCTITIRFWDSWNSSWDSYSDDDNDDYEYRDDFVDFHEDITKQNTQCTIELCEKQKELETAKQKMLGTSDWVTSMTRKQRRKLQFLIESLEQEIDYMRDELHQSRYA